MGAQAWMMAIAGGFLFVSEKCVPGAEVNGDPSLLVTTVIYQPHFSIAFVMHECFLPQLPD